MAFCCLYPTPGIAFAALFKAIVALRSSVVMFLLDGDGYLDHTGVEGRVAGPVMSWKSHSSKMEKTNKMILKCLWHVSKEKETSWQKYSQRRSL